MRFGGVGLVAACLVAMMMVLSAGALVGIAESESLNETSSLGEVVWSTATDVSDLMGSAESSNDDSSSSAAAAALVNDRDDFDGGFSSLDGMLQWAIGHSDPAKLKETAEDVQHLSPADLKNRQLEIKELMDKLKMPSDAKLMQIAIDDLKNSSLSLEDRHRALEELLILVEPIDNANDLYKLGGLVVVIAELNHPDPYVRRISAWILGKASQNNAVVQKQVLELGALSTLMKMVKSTNVEEAIKALYAVSALIRNNLAGQDLFIAEAGDIMVQDILCNSNIDIRLPRKAVSLVADLAESQLQHLERAELPLFSNRAFLKSVVDLMASIDLDLQEKALVAIKNLLQLRTTEALIFKDSCDLDGALERMRQQLQDSLKVEDHRDYAMDVENLRREVELIFNKKLRMVVAPL